jgi:hypothetical protein
LFNSSGSEEAQGKMNTRLLIAAVWGALMGVLTFAAGPLAWTSPHMVIAAIQIVLTYMLVPGLIVAAGVGPLGPAALINALVHFGICFLALRFLPVFKRKTVHD